MAPFPFAALAGDLHTVTASLRAATVAVETGRRGIGSGVAWDDAGTIVTNAHVATAERVMIRTSDGRRVAARVLARDDARDVAVLVPERALSLGAITPAPLTMLRPGALVLALGHPLGIPDAVTTGVLHGLGPAPAFAPLPPHVRARRWLRADVALAPGNSGGPLADSAGRLLGLNTMIVGGLALAVPVDDVARFVAAVRGADASGAQWW
jgi:serine protease Do